jgi:hypothetical protein
MKLALACGNLLVSELWGTPPLKIVHVGHSHRCVVATFNIFELGKTEEEEAIERSHAPTGPPEA